MQGVILITFNHKIEGWVEDSAGSPWCPTPGRTNARVAQSGIKVDIFYTADFYPS